MLLSNCKLTDFAVRSWYWCNFYRSRILIKPSTSDGTLFQLILFPILDCVRDCYASSKGTWYCRWQLVVFQLLHNILCVCCCAFAWYMLSQSVHPSQSCIVT